MFVTIRFVGALRGISGKSKITLNFEDALPLREVVKKLVEEIPTIKRILIDPELEDPRPNTLILVNGREISVLNGLETMIKNGDELVFVPVTHGG
ncbi:MAG: MoaD/ThiS family protein [Candidatus Bathyarchaeia archaeon]